MGGRAVMIAVAACGFLAVACGSGMAAENEGTGRELLGYGWYPPPPPAPKKYNFKLDFTHKTRGDTHKNVNVGKNEAGGYIANNVNPQMNQVGGHGDQGSGVHNTIVAGNTKTFDFGGYRKLKGYSWNPPPPKKFNFKLDFTHKTRGDTKKNANVGKNTAHGYVANNVNPQMNQVGSRGAQHSYVENKVVAGNTIDIDGGFLRKLQGYGPPPPPPKKKYNFKLDFTHKIREDTHKNANIGKNDATGYVANNVNPQMNQVGSGGAQHSYVENKVVAGNTLDLPGFY